MTDTSDVDQWLESLEAVDASEARDATELRSIGAAVIELEHAVAVLDHAVGNAHDGGRSWTEIANVLGVSRQAARQRFVDAKPGPAITAGERIDAFRRYLAHDLEGGMPPGKTPDELHAWLEGAWRESEVRSDEPADSD